MRTLPGLGKTAWPRLANPWLGRVSGGGAPAPADPYLSNVSLLMGFDDLVNINTFKDESILNNPFNVLGTPYQSDVSSMFGGAGYINEDNSITDLLPIPIVPSISGFLFRTGDFTIEGFFNSTYNHALYYHSIIGNFASGVTGTWSVFLTNTSQLQFNLVGFGSLTTAAISAGWHHFAISRNGGTLRIFVDGVMLAKNTDVAAWDISNNENAVCVGGNNVSDNDYWRGYLDEIRVTHGVGRYDADTDIAVPTEKYPRPSTAISGFPYDFPLLSVSATDGLASDWTVVFGNMYPKDTNPDRWVLLNTTYNRAIVYQEFAIAAGQYSVIDAGNARIRISHNILTYDQDTDGAVAFVRFYDASMNFLGSGASTVNQNSDVAVISEKYGIFVPPLTRHVRIGWQGYLHTGSELSAYVKDLSATISASNLVTAAEVLFSEFDADTTPWTITLGALGTAVYPAAVDYKPSGDAKGYNGGSVADSVATRSFAVPSGWASRIANGKVRALVRCTASNANQDDQPKITIGCNNGSTVTETTSGFLSPVWRVLYVELDAEVPADTTSFDLTMAFHRLDGTVNDAIINQISVLLYELA